MSSRCIVSPACDRTCLGRGRKAVPIALLLGLCACLSLNCFQVVTEGVGADKVASLSSVAGGDFTLVKHFSVNRTCWYALWGLIPLGRPDVGEIVKAQTAGADAAVNVKVVSQYGPVDCLVDVFLSGLSLGTLSMQIEGDVVKYAKAK